MKTLLRVLLAALMITLMFGGWLVYCGIQQALDAEQTLRAHNLVLDVIERFVEEHGSWPTGWDDLDTVSDPDGMSPSCRDWPGGSERIRDRIRVRFGVSASELRDMTEPQFDLIEQTDPHYPITDGEIDMFLDRIRRDLACENVCENVDEGD